MKICFSTRHDPEHFHGRGGGGYKFEKIFSEYLTQKGYAITHDINEDYDVLVFIQATKTCTEIRDIIAPKKLKGTKILHRVDGYPVPRVRNGDEIMARINALADITVFQSQYSKKMSEVNLKGPNTIIYNGADTAIFNPQGKKVPWRDHPTLLYGKWATGKPEKGFEYTLEQFKEIRKVYPTAHLRLVGRYGDGTIHALPEGVTWGGALGHEALAVELRSADVILFPSINDWCSMFCLESMASGVPLVYHPSGGTIELVGDTAIPIETDMLIAVKRALSDEGKQKAILARKRVETYYTKEIMCENYLKVMEGLLNGK